MTKGRKKGKFCRPQHSACDVLSVIQVWVECADVALIPIILPLNLPLTIRQDNALHTQAIKRTLTHTKQALLFAASAIETPWWLKIYGLYWGNSRKKKEEGSCRRMWKEQRTGRGKSERGERGSNLGFYLVFTWFLVSCSFIPNGKLKSCISFTSRVNLNMTLSPAEPHHPVSSSQPDFNSS